MQKWVCAAVVLCLCASAAAAVPLRTRPRPRHRSSSSRGRHRANSIAAASGDNKDASEAMGFINFMNNPSLAQTIFIWYVALEDNMNPFQIADGSKMLHRGNKILTAFRRIFGIKSR